MKAGLSQSTQLRQELKVNPRLYQAMDMLYMPLLDLQQHLKQELLVNPFLELSEEEEEPDGDTITAEEDEEESPDETTAEVAETAPEDSREEDGEEQEPSEPDLAETVAS